MRRKLYKLPDYFADKDIREMVDFIDKVENSYLYINDIPYYYVSKIDLKRSQIFLKRVVPKKEKITEKRTYYMQDYSFFGINKYTFSLDDHSYLIDKKPNFESNQNKAYITTNNTVTTYEVEKKSMRPLIVKVDRKLLWFKGQVFAIKDIQKGLAATSHLVFEHV